MKLRNIRGKAAVLGVVAMAMLIGAIGASVLKTNTANAQTTTPATTNTTTTQTATNAGQSSINNGTPNGTFKSNEDPTHEAKESAQWEEQENAGQAPWQKTNNGQ